MSRREHIRRRYLVILSSIGLILLLASAIMLTPLLLLLTPQGDPRYVAAFAVPAGLLALLGTGLWRGLRPPSGAPLSIQDGGIIVVLGWVIVVLFSAWPFTRALGLPYSRALFESMSGWTTTGLSVIDVAQAGPMILLWRSVMQLAGGAGLAIIMVSAIVGPPGVGIPNAEGRSDQLVPHVRESARLVLMIYLAYAAAGTLAYLAAGMSAFDAANHAFAAVSTGGFSTHPESIGYWDSPLIEGMTLALMLLGSLSFVTAWSLWRGDIRSVVRNGEVLLLGVVVPLAIAAAFLFTTHSLYPDPGKAARVAVFETVSAITTTGFQTVSYGNWNGFGILLLVLLMLIGGGTCSTAGGIKQIRIYLLWKQLLWEIRGLLLPRTAVLERPIWEGTRRVFIDDARIRQIAVFVFLYLATCAAGTLALCACGIGLEAAVFEFASALGTVGLSVGVTAAAMPDVALWAETVAMFLGRLELTVVIVSLLRIARDLRD